MEAQTLLLHRQLAKIKQRPDIVFKIVYHVLIVNGINIIGKNRLPMAHQTMIVAVISSQILQVIGEVLALCPELFETTKAIVHWIAQGINNFGIGHRQQYQTHIDKVIG